MEKTGVEGWVLWGPSVHLMNGKWATQTGEGKKIILLIRIYWLSVHTYAAPTPTLNGGTYQPNNPAFHKKQ